MSLYSEYAANLGRIEEGKGAALAEAQRARGQIWGSALGSLGQLAANLPQQLQENQVNQLKLTQLKQSLAGQQRANQVVAQLPRNPDGTYDTGTMLQRFAQAGVPADEQARWAKSFDELNGIARKTKQDQTDRLADIANVVLSHHKDGEPITPDAVHLGFAVAKGMGLAQDSDEQPLTQLMTQGADPEQLLKTIRGLGSKFAAEKPIVLPRPGSKLVTPTGQTLAEIPANEPGAKNPTEASMALEAAGGDPAKALELLKTSKPAAVPNVGSFDDYVTRKYGPNPTSDQIIKARKEYGQADDRAVQPATIVVQTVDENGRPVTKVVPKVAGATYQRAPSATTETRLASAQAVNQTGEDIIARLSDPAIKAQLGPVLGRYNSLRDFIGNPPPALAEIAGQIESYALANMGVHGMRSAQGAEQIKQLLDRKHTAESLIATIKGLNAFSSHFMENEGRKSGASASPAAVNPTGRFNPATGKVEPIGAR